MAASFSLPHLHATGTHYQVAFEIAREFKNRIHEYFRINENIHEDVLPFIETEKGKKICKRYLDAVSGLYPWYVDEIRGISDGCGLPFDQVLAINLRVEILHLTSKKQENCQVIADQESSGRLEELVQECSDFFLINQDHTVMVHNEDSSRHIYRTGYLVSCKITGGQVYENGLTAPDEEFTCHCYPAQIPGNAYAFNSSGFVFTVNALVPKQIALGRLPRQFLTRAMLGCQTLMEIEDLFLKVPVAYAVNVNVGYFGDATSLKTQFTKNVYELDSEDTGFSTSPQTTSEHQTPIVLNYEIATSALHNAKLNRLSKHCLVSAEAHSRLSDSFMYSANHYFHFNHFERIKMEECVINSSWNRAKRSEEYVSELGTIRSAQDLLVLASDSQNSEYPIYRSISNSKIHPIATAVFDLKAKVLSIYIDKPTENQVFLKILLEHKP